MQTGKEQTEIYGVYYQLRAYRPIKNKDSYVGNTYLNFG